MINITLGSAWGLALGGAFFNFYYFLPYGLVTSVFLGFLGTIPGLFMIVTLEFFTNFRNVKKEKEKQTKLLEQILQELSKKTGN